MSGFAERRFHPRAGIVSCALGDEEALLDTEQGVYYSLNPVGRAVWEMMGDGLTVEAVEDAIVTRFDIDRQTAQADITALIASLERASLIVPHHA